MQRMTLLVFGGLLGGVAQAQGLLDAINTPDRTTQASHQSLTGTWMMELRRPGAPAGAPTILNMITASPDGTVLGSSGDATQTAAHGVWLRVGDRKFLQTMYVFAFNEANALTTVTKVRIVTQMSADGQTLKGTQEVAVLDRDGKVMATIPGGTHSAVRLSAEKPADFEAFLAVQ